MQFIKYSDRLKDKLVPIELAVNQPCNFIRVADYIIRNIKALENSSIGTCHLSYERLFRWPFEKSMKKISGIFQGKYFEHFFICGWNSGTVGGPDKAILKDKNDTILARSEKVYCDPQKISKDLSVLPVHTLYLPDGVFHLKLNEYRQRFFDVGPPRYELELFDSTGTKYFWGGVRKPQGHVKIFQTVDNLHILLSMLVPIYTAFAYCQYP